MNIIILGDVNEGKNTTIGHLSVVEAPGHRDFLKNLITGEVLGDVALLVVDARLERFEEGVAEGGRIREHALLAFTLGIRLVVGVNRMGDVGFSEERFLEIEERIRGMLQEIGFTGAVAFVPYSGSSGDNMDSASENMSWWTGNNLGQELNYCESLPVKPLRLPIQEIYNVSGIGTVLSGRVQTGKVKVGDPLFIAPLHLNTRVGEFAMIQGSIQEGQPGDMIGFQVEVNINQLERGFVCGESINDPPRAAIGFVAQIIVLDFPGEINNGYTPIIEIHSAQIPCRFDHIISKIDRRTGLTVEENPESLEKGDCALITIIPTQPLCVESFRDYPSLGRFSIKDDQDQTIISGIIKSVNKQTNK